MKKGVYKQLNLTHLEAALPHVLEEARHEQWTYEVFLERALAAEVGGREQKAIARRLKAARLPNKKTLDGFDFSCATLALGAPTARTRRSLLRAQLHQCRVPWPSRNRQNAFESGAGGSGAHCWLFGGVYDAG